MPNTLVVTKGHPFEREAYFAMLDALATQYDIGELTHVEHPAAPAAFAPDTLAAFDCVLFYDMPGIAFGPDGPAYAAPSPAFQEHLMAATRQGTGLVFTHHALAGWPAWDDYAELIGGRFCYTPQRLRGEPVMDSGYRHKVTHKISLLAEHPVTAGLPSHFEMTDELYLAEVFTSEVTPLLASDYEFVAANFYSAAKVVLDGEMYANSGWDHAPGSNLVGWVRNHNASRVVYLQGGDDAEAYASPHYQRLLANAIGWAGQGRYRAT